MICSLGFKELILKRASSGSKIFEKTLRAWCVAQGQSTLESQAQKTPISSLTPLTDFSGGLGTKPKTYVVKPLHRIKEELVVLKAQCEGKTKDILSALELWNEEEIREPDKYVKERSQMLEELNVLRV